MGKGRNAAVRRKLRGARFDILGDFRQSGAGVGGGEFQAMILRRIVAGCEVDSAIELAAHDFECHRGRGREGFAQERANAVMLQDVHGKLGELFGVETRIIAHQNRGFFCRGFCMLRDSGDRQAHVGEGKIVGNQSAPSRGAKLNGGAGHEAIF